MKKKDLIEKPNSHAPHVVLLGAGASRAAFPNGEAGGKKLPLMNDIVNVIRLDGLLKKADIDISKNFEVIYPTLDEKIKKEVELKIEEYFSQLRLPDDVTLYDRLLLSLREKDAIFTFNWDPFLFDAYKRNEGVVTLPKIYFLHGNVRIAECVYDKCFGKKGDFCPKCKKLYTEIPLLYPVENKNYADVCIYTKNSWEKAKYFFANAFTFTVFGYRAPQSDVEAVDIIYQAWFNKREREMEHIEIIDTLCTSELYDKWYKFTPTYHAHFENSFENSRLYRWPRRTCEALFYPMKQGNPCEEFPFCTTNNLEELQKMAQEIAKHE